MGEQGTEASHQTISYLAHYRAHAIKDQIKKYEHIMKSHLLHILTTLQLDTPQHSDK